MKKLLILIIFLITMPTLSALQNKHLENTMKIKLTFDTHESVITLYDNAAARELASHLPVTVTFSDYAGQEKITYLPQKLNLQHAPRGAVPKSAEVTIFAPWGNLAIFYKDHGFAPDYSLIPIGRVESGLNALAAMKKDFKAVIKRIESE